VIRKTTQEKPFNATHWSTRTMAAATGLSETTVRRIWHANGLKPHLVKTFKVSNDARFAEKLEAIVGLYLNPPEHAIVLCADEKSQIPGAGPDAARITNQEGSLRNHDARLQAERNSHAVRRYGCFRWHRDQHVR
jgi:hypothetical protein